MYLSRICETEIGIPEHAIANYKHGRNKTDQEITIECLEGFEFTDTPVKYNPVDNTTPSGCTRKTRNCKAQPWLQLSWAEMGMPHDNITPIGLTIIVYFMVIGRKL